MADDPEIKHHDLLWQVAELYYVQDWTQSQLAKHTGLSQSQISRMVKEARERGIVEIRVHRPYQVHPELQAELCEKLGLRDCQVLALPGHEENSDESVPARVGVLAAQYLRRHVEDNSAIGIGWGSMVHHTIRSGHLTGKRGMTVAQIQGGVGGATHDVDGARLVDSLGQQLHAKTFYLNAPMVVADPMVRSGLLRDPHIRRTLDIGRRSQALIVGVGAVTQQSGLYRAGYLTDADLAYIADEGAVGDVCGSYFREDGSACTLELDDRVVALRREEMLRVPLRVGVSAGIAKACANIGAARSGLVNVLVTDEHAAAEMLDFIDASSQQGEPS